MNTGDQSGRLADNLPVKDYAERGLRILARIIARDLVRRSTVIQDESSYCKTNDLPDSKDTL